MELRPYQKEAIEAIKQGWNEHQKELLVLPTGTGKTVVFSQIAHDESKNGRVLIMAHRDELIEQARAKYTSLTGDATAKEKASDTCIGSSERVVVGSVQTMQRDRRLSRFSHDYFDTIIVDEAHHCLSSGYQKVLKHFPHSKVLGVTATPDRGDKKDLSKYFDNIAYEYNLKQAIKDGYLCDIKARTIPLEIDMSDVKVRVGDFEVNQVAETLQPYLPEIARNIKEYASDRKTVVFLPLVSIAKEFQAYLEEVGLEAREVNGESGDRKETLEWFDKAGKGSVLCNAMLLTEGWDCPSVDCVVILRPTKIRSLYVQMVGRGTRLAKGKDNLLLLDFLWLCQRHNLCRPSHLVTNNEEDQVRIAKASDDEEIDLLGAESDAVEARKNALAEAIAKNKKKKGKLVNPLDFFAETRDMELMDYEPIFKWEFDEPTEKQLKALENYGFNTDGITKGLACQLISKVIERSGLATPKQIRTLSNFGYENVAEWTFDEASKRISMIAAAGWKTYKLPKEYRP